MLNRITLRGIVTRNTRDGVSWSGSVYLDETRVAYVENGGRGGCCSFHPVGGDFAGMRTFLNEATLASNVALGGRPSPEAFENLLSCTAKGMTVAQAVPVWKALMAGSTL